MSNLLLGNEAVARGAYEAGVRVAAAYPGTPSTEITEYIAKYPEVYAEWSPNEKVALEAAVGASIGGARAMCSMKHVGLNVAADPLFTVSYTGVNGGLVICVADDPGMHSSQNEQDSRRYAVAARIPMLEPSDSRECLAYMKLAFELSERCDTPVLVRLTTRVAHARSLAEQSPRVEIPLRPYVKDPGKYVMMPGMARKRRELMEERTDRLFFALDSLTANQSVENFINPSADSPGFDLLPINRIEWNGRKIGVITSGITYQQAKQALGDQVSYLKLGMVHPLPDKLIKEFISGVEICYVIEELDPVIEQRCAAMGHSVRGKDLFPRWGEIDSNVIKKVILNENTEVFEINEPIPARPPVLCAGCPHRAVFHVMRQMKLTVMGDIGCYTLGALTPLQTIDACVCMGASIGMAHGMEKAMGDRQSKKTVAVIGDSTFLHSGVTGLMNTVYNKGASTTVILDNSITGMTGHQDHPATGKTIKGEPTHAVDLVKICEAVGVKRVKVVDALDMAAVKAALQEELAADEPSVIIARRPCRLIIPAGKKAGAVKLKEDGAVSRYQPSDVPLRVSGDTCVKCGACLRIGCPALSKENGVFKIDAGQCNGCGACKQICPSGAIGNE